MNKEKYEIQWFPMCVAYSRELKLESCLYKIGIENYAPMFSLFIEKTEVPTHELNSAFHNLIFVHFSQ